jgi:hypothetical protein
MRTFQNIDIILNVYALNIRASKLIIETLLIMKKQIGPDTIIMRELNTMLSSTERTSRKN